MGMSRCYSLMKCLLIIFNILFLCVGCGACGFAAWALWDGGASESASGRAGLCALAAWGCALGVAALAALCGALRPSAALLAAAVALLALTALAEAAAAWWGAAHLPQLRAALLQRLDRTVRHDYGVMPARTQLVDAIQQGLECCGASDPRDWQSSAWSRSVVAGAGAGQGQGAGAGAGALAAPSPHATEALDLSVSAPAAYYWVPTSCCIKPESASCSSSRRLPLSSGVGGAGAGGAGGGGGGLHAAGCGARVLGALEQAARAPLAAAGALLLAHAAALVLALLLAVRAHPLHRYKA